MAKAGRRPNVPADVLVAILMARADGFGYARIANALNEDHVPTSQGGRQWWPATVRAVVLADRRNLGL